MEKSKENTIDNKKETFETKRIEKIFSDPSKANIDHWKKLFTEDLKSESEYLRNRAQNLLGLIQEKENSLSRKETVQEVIEQSTEIKTEAVGEQVAPDEVINIEKEEVLLTKEEIPKETEKITTETEVIKSTEILETQEVVEQKQEEKLVESLSKEEIKTVQEEIKTSTLEKFEPEQVKTNLGLFLRNQVVKLASGFKVSEKMKAISLKMRRGVLLGTGILVLWPSALGKEGKTVLPENVNGKVTTISHEKVAKVALEQDKKTIDASFYYKLSPSAQEIYLYSFKNIVDSSFLILDKPTATMYVIGKDKNLIGSFPVLVGKTKGEAPNRSDVDSDLAGPHATTPAGKYKIGRKEINRSDYVEYQGKIFSIYGSDDLGIHMTYPGEYAKRTKALNTPTSDDNKATFGCVNADKENFKYLDNLPENTTLFITTDDPNLSLNPQTGKIGKQTLVHQYAVNPKTGKVENKSIAQTQQTKNINTKLQG